MGALIQCKQYQLVVTSGVSGDARVNLHRVIHTCVENFTRAKYFAKSSARGMLARAKNFCAIENAELKFAG